jgi:hypothetical protein
VSPAPAGETPAERFFEELRNAHEAAAAAAGGVRGHHFRMAGRNVALRLAGPAAEEPFTAALGHLARDPAAEPDLTVLVFDSASTGTPPPPAPWGPDEVREAGVVESFSDERFRTVVQVPVEMATMLDRRQGLAVCWVRDAAMLPMPERAAPLRRMLQGWLGDLGLVLVHAGAVGTPEGGVLLSGWEGSGKSSSALSCLDSALLYASDDYCAVDPGPQPWVHSLYSTGKTAVADLPHIPLEESMIGNPEETPQEKALYFLHRHRPERLTAGFPLRAILLPQVGGSAGSSALEPVSRGAALRSLAPTSVLLSPQAGSATLAALSRLTARLPAYRLRLGPDRSEIPDVITHLLEELGTPSEAAERVPA